MYYPSSNKQMKKGFLLITIYLIIIVLTILSASLIYRIISSNNLVNIHRYTSQALYAAEAGLDRGLLWLRDQASPPAGTSLLSPAILQNVNLDSGTFTVTIDPYDNNPSTFLDRYKITSTGTVSGIQKILTMDVMTDTFARYAYFTDDEHYLYAWWKIPVWFANNDRIRGPLHTNSHLHISNDPIFDDLVRTVDSYVTYYHGGAPYDNPQFNGGLTLGVDTIHMPSKAVDLRTAAVHDGLHIEGPTTIVLRNDGTMDVTNAQRGWTNTNMTIPVNGAIFVTGGNVNLSGTLNGQLSIGTNRDIVVTNNILYATNPQTNPESTDMLGLIAERDLIISKSAPYDLEIDASTMALGENFIVEEWWKGPPKGTLTVLGGIIQKERGPVGTFNGATGQKVSGYSKNYIYDSRLLNQTPPHYPMTGDYILLLWKKNT